MTENPSPSAPVELTFELDERSVRFVVDETLYSLDAIYGAAYLFVDRCYVFLSRPAEQKVDVRLRARESATPADLEAMAGQFANELLNQVLRLRVAESTAKIREYYMARAFFSEPPRPNIDAILAELDAEEMDADPLEIRLPWDEKRKKELEG